MRSAGYRVVDVAGSDVGDQVGRSNEVDDLNKADGRARKRRRCS